MWDLLGVILYMQYPMPYGDGVRVVVVVFHCKWAQAGPVLFCQRGGCAPYCGPRGAILKTPNIEKYSYSEFYFLYYVIIFLPQL
jgi:hypothetical protein